MFLSRTINAGPNNQWVSYYSAMPRISVDGHQFRRQGERFKSWGFQPLSHFFHSDYYLNGGVGDRAWIGEEIAGNAGMGANTMRIHLQLWEFIEGYDKSNLLVRPLSMSNFIHVLNVAKEHSVYLLVSGNNTWLADDIPAWYDLLEYEDRWDVQEFFFSELVKAVVSAGHATTVLGYELASEPYISTNPAAPWNGTDFFGLGIYFTQAIARGPGVDDDTVRDWITMLTAAIKNIDPDALVTIGLFPFFTGGFGVENIQDLVDFASPHIYPPSPFSDDETVEGQLAYAIGWASGDIPILVGETGLWSVVEQDNIDFMEGIIPLVDGMISFSYGYPPEQFTTPPEPPLFPADPDTDPTSYALQGESIAQFISYRSDFLES